MAWKVKSDSSHSTLFVYQYIEYNFKHITFHIVFEPALDDEDEYEEMNDTIIIQQWFSYHDS